MAEPKLFVIANDRPAF